MIFLIDKPEGITSYDVIRRLKKDGKVNTKEKIGHAGTLDPMATGLMIIGTDSDTKKLNKFLKLDKEYEATIKLGIKTNTGDITGEVLGEKAVPNIAKEKILEVLSSLIGEHEYVIPVFSAVKSGGEPLYKKARRGEKIDAPFRKMKVISAELLDFNCRDIKAKFFVGSGTYIRSLAEVVGERLGTLATLSQLRRTKIGDFDVEKAETI